GIRHRTKDATGSTGGVFSFGSFGPKLRVAASRMTTTFRLLRQPAANHGVDGLADRLLAGMVLIANQAAAARTGSPCRLSPSPSNGTSTKAKAVKAADTRISGASLLRNR